MKHQRKLRTHPALLELNCRFRKHRFLTNLDIFKYFHIPPFMFLQILYLGFHLSIQSDFDF